MATDIALTRALRFLRDRQLPWGQFPVYMGPTLGDGTETFDDTPFATAHIAHSLTRCQSPAARPLLDGAVAYLESVMEPPGVWRYWGRDHEYAGAMPPDVDDIASISDVLRRVGRPVPDNRAVLAGNRRGDGLFYTWVWPRLRSGRRDPAQLRVALRSLRAPVRSAMFWRINESSHDDVDAVVNANVVLYLGEDEITRPAVEHLVRVFRSGEEAVSDKWYRNPFAFYYAVSRCIDAGVTGLAVIRDELAARVESAVARGPLDTALAVSTLVNLGVRSDALARGIEQLVATQRRDGGWAMEPFYFGGPAELMAFGSEALTTAFCIEALDRSQPPVLAALPDTSQRLLRPEPEDEPAWIVAPGENGVDLVRAGSPEPVRIDVRTLLAHVDPGGDPVELTPPATLLLRDDKLWARPEGSTDWVHVAPTTVLGAVSADTAREVPPERESGRVGDFVARVRAAGPAGIVRSIRYRTAYKLLPEDAEEEESTAEPAVARPDPRVPVVGVYRTDGSVSINLALGMIATYARTYDRGRLNERYDIRRPPLDQAALLAELDERGGTPCCSPPTTCGARPATSCSPPR